MPASNLPLPSDFRWRVWLLAERINETFMAARQKAYMSQPSLRDPRGQWALEHKDSDPFAGAIWNCDQVLKPDHLPDPWHVSSRRRKVLSGSRGR